MKKNILIALLFIGGLAACSDSDDSDIPDNPGYPVTHFSKIELSEVKTERLLHRLPSLRPMLIKPVD